MTKQIHKFIEDFSNISGKEPYLCGLCYWFAFILKNNYGGRIVYLPVEGHFVLSKYNKFILQQELWDITGNVTGKYINSTQVDWETYSTYDYEHARRIERDCVELGGYLI